MIEEIWRTGCCTMLLGNGNGEMAGYARASSPPETTKVVYEQRPRDVTKLHIGKLAAGGLRLCGAEASGIRIPAVGPS